MLHTISNQGIHKLAKPREQIGIIITLPFVLTNALIYHLADGVPNDLESLRKVDCIGALG